MRSRLGPGQPGGTGAGKAVVATAPDPVAVLGVVEASGAVEALAAGLAVVERDLEARPGRP